MLNRLKKVIAISSQYSFETSGLMRVLRPWRRHPQLQLAILRAPTKGNELLCGSRETYVCACNKPLLVYPIYEHYKTPSGSLYVGFYTCMLYFNQRYQGICNDLIERCWHKETIDTHTLGLGHWRCKTTHCKQDQLQLHLHQHQLMQIRWDV